MYYNTGTGRYPNDDQNISERNYVPYRGGVIDDYGKTLHVDKFVVWGPVS